MQNQLSNLTELLTKFVNSSSASTLSSGTLPSNTIANPRKATKDTVHPTNNRITEDVQPPVVRTQSPILTFEPVNSPTIEPVASPVSALKPNLRPSIPYLSRLQDQKLRDKANDQQLADHLISRPVRVAEDFYVKVDTFHFPTDFVVVDFDAGPRVPLILKRSFLKTERALIDVFKEYSQEVLGFFDVIVSGNPTPYCDPIVSTTSPTLTPFRNSDFLLGEVDAFLALEDDPTLPEVDQSYLDSERDILLLEAFLNDDSSLPPPNQGNYLPEVHKELKIYKAQSNKSLIDEPLEVELKDLPTYLEYVFLEGDDKLPVIITKDLSVEEKTALITILKSHKPAIAWKLSDIKGINPEFCTRKILIEDDFKPTVQHQRRVNPKIHYVIKQEVLKLLDAGLIYPISDSP
nr:hypothetical protein [Tanacetum cinerariifolium]